MPDSPAANVTLLPWVRQGAAASIPAVDTLGVQAGAAVLTAELAINGAEGARTPVQLLGPADAIGIAPRAIVRRAPTPNAPEFESNHFACIEFDRPDFPWLFTPARADGQGRLRPWLCLIVVRRQDGVSLRPAAAGPLPVLEIAAPADPRAELPDLTESFLWAHAQAAGGSGTTSEALGATLAGDPRLALSRLICPRLLMPDTDYVACVVPAFEAGRKAGLGEDAAGTEPLQPAWTDAAPGPVRLPVYDQWAFRTGSGGDFKSLVERLRPQPAPDRLGRRAIGVGRPGFALPATFPADATLDGEGALLPVTTPDAPPAWPEGTEAPFRSALAAIVDAAERLAPGPDDDPLLTPPLYGRWHADRRTADPEAAAPTWFDELNLDPRHRATAAFGTRVVQAHQEALMASAWAQAGDLERANQRLRQLQLSLFVGTSLHARHFDRMAGDRLLRVGAPALGRIRIADAGGPTAATLVSRFVGAALPLPSLAPAMRKLTRASGPISRRLERAARIPHPIGGFVARMNSGTIEPFRPPPPTIATFNTIRAQIGDPGSIRIYQQVTEAAVAAMPGAPQFQLMPEGAAVPLPVEGAVVAPVDNPVAAAFRQAAKRHLARLNPARPWILVFIPPKTLDLGALRTTLSLQMQPRRMMTAMARALVRGGDSTPAGSPTAIDTVMFAPRFAQPMYSALRDLSQDLLLPGLEAVGPDCVLGLRTNRRFVDAYMVGLNFEMGRELLWRGFPTDQRGTYFAQFWDTAGGVARSDIDAIHLWGARRLGAPRGTPEAQFVMLLRSELLRRYPTAAIYAVPAIEAGSGRSPSLDAEAEVHPAFRGTLPPDVTFIGFDLTVAQVLGGPGNGAGFYIVIQEQPTEPQFGLDAGAAPAGAGHLEAAPGPPDGLALRGLQWGRNGAHMAGITRRTPVRVAIHASRFVPPPEPPA